MLMFMPGILLIMLALGIAFGDVPEHFGFVVWRGVDCYVCCCQCLSPELPMSSL